MNIEDKIKTGKLEDITEEEYATIEQDQKLAKELYEKMVELNIPFDDVSETFTLTALNTIPGAPTYFFTQLYNQDIDQIVTILDLNKEDISQELGGLSESATNEIVTFLENNRENIYTYLKTTDESIIYSITSPKTIKYIVDNKIYLQAGAISPEEITPEIEDFICEAIINSDNIKRINTVTRKIILTCIQTSKFKFVASSVNPDDEEQMSIIKKAIEEGTLYYNEIINSSRLQDYLRKHDKNYLRFFIKKQLLTEIYPYFRNEEIEEIKENPEILIEIFQEMNRLQIESNHMYLDPITRISDECLLIMLQNLHSYFKYYIEENYYSSNKIEFIKKHLDELKDPLAKYLEDNQDKAFDSTINFIEYNLIDYAIMASKYLSIEKVLEISSYQNRSLSFITNRTEYIKRISELNNYSISKLPDNINLDVLKTLPETLLLKIIPILSFEQLTPENLPISEFANNEAIINAIFKRLIELKSNKFNNQLWQLNDQNYTEIFNAINDPKNPLNLTIEQSNTYLSKIKTDQIPYLLKIIKTQKNITQRDVDLILNTIINNINNQKTDKTDELLNLMFDKVPDKMYIYNNFIKYSMLNDYSSEATEYFHNYFRTRTDVPLFISDKFNDDELVINSTFKNIEESAFENSQFLNSNQQKYTNLKLDAILNSIKNNQKVCLELCVFGIKNIIASNNIEELQLLINYLNTDKLIINYDANEMNSLFIELIDKLNILKELNIDLNAFDEFFEKYLTNLSNSNITYIINNSKLLINYSDRMKEALKIKLTTALTSSDNFSVDSILAADMLFDLNLLHLLPRLTVKTHNRIYLLNKLKDNPDNEYVLETIKQIINQEQFQEIFKSYLENAILINPSWLKIYLDRLDKDSYICFSNLIHVEKNELFKAKVLECLKTKNLNYDNYNISYVFENVEYIQALLKNEPTRINEFIKRLIELLLHNEIKINYNVFDQVFDQIFPILINQYNLDKNAQTNFLTFYKLYQNSSLKLLLNDNYLKLLSLPPEDFNKILELIKVKEITFSDVSFINESLRQNIYPNEHQDVVSIFVTLLGKIQLGLSEEDEIYYSKLLSDYIPKNITEIIKPTKDEGLLILLTKDKELFLKQLFMKVGEQQSIYSETLRQICNSYILRKRNEDVKTYNPIEDLGLKYYFEEKVLYEGILKLYLSNHNSHFKITTIVEALNNEMPITKIDRYTILFLMNPQHYELANLNKEQLQEIKKNIGPLKNRIFTLFKTNQTIKDNIDRMITNETFLSSLPANKRIPIIQNNTSAIEEIISKLEIDNVLAIIHNEKKYNAILKAIKKYKLLNWDETFNKVIERCSLGETQVEYSNFLNYFDKIYYMEIEEYKRKVQDKAQAMLLQGIPKEEVEAYLTEELRKIKNEEIEITFTPFKILKYSTMFSSIANCYKIILGIEDFELIREDRGPNSARSPVEVRLEDTCNLALQMISEKEVTIPSFIHEVTFPDGRKINVIIGNKSNTVNLTHGERTGACMRSQGYCDYLFHLCATDKRAFHITFVDPTTDRYLSRVSGFRNGNSVFLNELRESLNTDKFSNEDIVFAAQSAAREIIRQSNDSTLPIENVIVSTDMAVSGHYNDSIILPIDNFRTGVYEESYYNLTTNNAFVLATTDPNHVLAPITLDADHQPVYEAVRTPRKEYNENQIDDNVKISVMRIGAIKQCLEHKEDPEYYKSIDLDTTILFTEFKYLIIANDWFVGLDSNNNVISECIEVDKRAIVEYNEALKDIEEIKKNFVGGTSYGK